jgi:choline-glycine betaine transporter
MTKNPETKKKRIKWNIFLPPWLILVAILIISCVDYDAFESLMSRAQSFVVYNFQWLFNSVTLVATILMVACLILPIKNVRFGGSKCQPLMSYSSYVWIILCTYLAAGILLWACAEPLEHIYNPPSNITEGPLSGASIRWAMQTMFLEWTFSPAAIYGLPGLLFAFVFFNMKKKYSIGSMLSVTLGDRRAERITPAVECVCLFCLVCGMAASMGFGVMLLSGGVSDLTGIPNGKYLYVICCLAIVVAFIASATSGVLNGIRMLSNINSTAYFILGAFVLLAGPTAYILDLLFESIGGYLTNFFSMSLWTSASEGDGWSRWWPTFYMCCWLAWMPIAALFLGKISRGFSVKEAVMALFVIPAGFSLVWIGLFSGSAIFYELSGVGVYEAIQAGGTEAGVFTVLRQLPLSTITIPIFLVIVFLAFVTAADSNTNAMAGLCCDGLNADDTESPAILKIVWGATTGVLCIVAVCGTGTDGIKMLCNVGGFPAAILFVFFLVGWGRIMANPAKYDCFQEDYDEHGQPIKSKRLDPLGEENKPKKDHSLQALKDRLSTLGRQKKLKVDVE